jgi:biotin operon repressor
MKPRSNTPQKEGPWGWQARDAVTKAGQLGINHHSIYCALTHFESAAANEHKHRFAVSCDQLAAHLNCSSKTVQRCLADLQKAGLIYIFSGTNGGRRKVRNSFFLATIRWDCESYRSDCESYLVKDSQSYLVKDCESVFNKKKEQLGPAPEGPDPNKEPCAGSACPPLRGGSVPKERKGTARAKIEHGMPEVSQEQIERHDRMVEFIERHGI